MLTLKQPIGTLGLKLCLVLVSIFIYNCAQMPLYRDEPYYHRVKIPSVKVKLLQTKDKLEVSPASSFVIRCHPQKEGEKSSEYFSSAKIWLKAQAQGLELGTENQEEFEKNLERVVFEPRGEKLWLSLDGKRYRGLLEVNFLPEDTTALALNLIFVEDYLKGVLPAEIGKWDKKEFEALKAQAIAARTYALYSLYSSNEKGYDLESTVADQLYLGADSEDKLSNLAIKKTKGMILIYGGKPIKAHYHANCGGWTEKVEEVWDKPPEPYLHCFGDDGFCTWAKNSYWEESWHREKLEEIISTYLGPSQQLPEGGIGKILDLKILKRAPSGRVSLLEIITDKNIIQLEKDNIRWVLRRNQNSHPILPSIFFEIELQRDYAGELKKIVFKGSGSGHGVGMCQIGALGRSRAGYTYRAILSHYYRGARIVKIY